MGRLSNAAGALDRSLPPAWRIRVDGLAADAVLGARVISVSVALHSGMQSDQLSMTLDDRPAGPGSRALAVPKTGKELEVLMGNTSGMASLGKYQVDQVTLSGSQAGRTMSITGVPRLMLGESTRTWADMALSDVVDTIARQNGLKARTSVAFKSGKYRIVEDSQLRESDLSFLTRLAERYDGLVKPMAGHLLFLKKGEASTASGTALSSVSLTPGDIVDWNCTLSDRTSYDAVVAIWHDLDHATQQQVRAGPASASNLFRLRHIHSSQDEARLAAESKLRELNRTTSSLTLSTLGNPLLTAEGGISVKHLRHGVDGDWLVESVTHTFDGSGYLCHLTACAKN